MNDRNYIDALWQAGIIKDKSRNNHIRRIEYNKQLATKYQQFMVNQQREIERLRKEMAETKQQQTTSENQTHNIEQSQAVTTN